ncbi:protein FATTY ACID EXPORT 4, chloroplastic [Selaginella moellendorffii]|uniref:protein FATTY ACID EXPORT 4, chloroplastic n=1 Tax=Selaginella moellendorffii TaxID=88036 RepID=UPI000D1C421B|nr:protein FATTY ACID EXPORT 4, chloroplastic [Selaginella moellendorffii]|eukprot:XP_002985108.2 protein FATTY ACID EXPORT 4, chloroplastic [Selaginella moellendorffii]
MEAILGLRAPSRAIDVKIGLSPRRIGNASSSSLKIGNARVGGVTDLRVGRSNGRKRRIDVLRCRAGLEEIAPATAAAYGLTLLSGGFFAYSRTGSKGSLVGGLTGGIAFAVAYLLMLNPDTKDLANAIGFGVAFLFIAVFGIRLAATRQPIPSGLLLAISIAASVVFVNAYFSARLL